MMTTEERWVHKPMGWLAFFKDAVDNAVREELVRSRGVLARVPNVRIPYVIFNEFLEDCETNCKPEELISMLGQWKALTIRSPQQPPFVVMQGVVLLLDPYRTGMPVIMWPDGQYEEL